MWLCTSIITLAGQDSVSGYTLVKCNTSTCKCCLHYTSRSLNLSASVPGEPSAIGVSAPSALRPVTTCTSAASAIAADAGVK